MQSAVTPFDSMLVSPCRGRGHAATYASHRRSLERSGELSAWLLLPVSELGSGFLMLVLSLAQSGRVEALLPLLSCYICIDLVTTSETLERLSSSLLGRPLWPIRLVSAWSLK